MNLKNKKICKLCDGDLFKDPILVLNKMPKAAQHFLNRKELPNFESINLKIYQCKKCGLVQLISKPVWYFKDVITAATISGKVRKLRLKQMKSFSKKYNLFGKKIIEVGCASGEMLDIIEEAKMLGYGLEHSAKSVSKGLKIGRKINKGFIEDTNKFDNGPFDGFLCYNFLEHLPNLKKAIKNIYNNLYEGGVGIVTVPNLKYLLKTKTHYEFVADHLSYFTQETISKAFNNLGFKILENILINNNNDIQIIVKKVLNNKKKKK